MRKIEREKFPTNLQSYQLEQQKLIWNWIEKLKPNLILDAGCGSGVLTKSMSDLAYWVGADISDIVDEFHGTPVGANLESLPFKNSSFDMSICIDVVEHMPSNSLSTIIQQLARVTANYVIFIIPTEPDLKVVSILCPFCGNSFHPSGHIHRIDSFEVEREFRKFGFELMEYRKIGDIFNTGILLDQVLMIKRTWEQSVCYAFACEKCGKVPKDYFEALRPEIYLKAIYNQLKNAWFLNVLSSKIEHTERAFLFVKSLNPKNNQNLIKPTDNKPCNKIEAHQPLSCVSSPYVFPSTSYLVVDSNVEIDFENKRILIKQGVLRLFFVSQPSEIRIVLDDAVVLSNDLVSAKYKTIDGNFDTKNFYTEGTRLVLNIDKLCYLEPEGYYFELLIENDITVKSILGAASEYEQNEYIK